MIKLYKVDNTRDSTIKGYWRDKGKVYIDKIHLSKHKTRHKASGEVNKLFKRGEKAVFYTLGNKAIIEDRQGNFTTLKTRQVIHKKKVLKRDIDRLLELHGGLTHFKDKNLIEIWR